MGSSNEQKSSDSFLHSYLGPVQRVVQKKQTVLLKQIDHLSKKDIDDWQLSIEILKSKSMQLSSLLIPREMKVSQTCGTIGSLQAQYEDYSLVLQDELLSRRNKKEHFNQEQIWYILFSLTEALHQFEFYNEKVADINPASILLNTHGQINICNKYTLPFSPSRYNLYSLPSQSLAFSFDSTYEVGMTIMECCILQPCDQLYNKLSKKVDHQLRNQYMRYFESLSYSQFLKFTVARMIKLEHRPSLGQIYSILSPYQAEIIDLKPFSFEKELSGKCLNQYFLDISSYPHLRTQYQKSDDFISYSQRQTQQSMGLDQLPSEEQQNNNQSGLQKNFSQVPLVYSLQYNRVSEKPLQERPILIPITINSQSTMPQPDTSLTTFRQKVSIMPIVQLKSLNIPIQNYKFSQLTPSNNCLPLLKQIQPQSIPAELPSIQMHPNKGRRVEERTRVQRVDVARKAGKYQPGLVIREESQQ